MARMLLPKKLLGDGFRLVDIAREQTPVYVFHDSSWGSDLRHLLGWAREAIVTLQGAKRLPKWLFGHACELIGTQDYRLSAANATYSGTGLLAEASHVLGALEGAGVALDQWGAKSLEGWPEAISAELDRKSHPGTNPYGWSLIRDLRSGMSDIELHNRLSDYGNVHHHPFYAIRGPLMASGIGQTHCNALLNADFQGATGYNGPTTIYCALFTATLSDTTLANETVYTNYARQAVTCNSTNFPNAAAGAISGSSANITFPTCGVTGATITTVAWCAASSGGTQTLWWGDLSASQAIASGNTPQFNVNALTMSGV